MAALRRVWQSWNRLSSGIVRPIVAHRYGSTASVKEEGPEPPNGFLFNEKPLLPGEKREKEDWENIWIYGMGTSMLLIFIVAIFKPHTGIDVWARKQAEERLQSNDYSTEQ